MTSPVIKRSIDIGGHKTSISLENEFWEALRKIAAHRQTTLSKLVRDIDATRDKSNLSSAVRVYVLRYYESRRLALARRPARDDETDPNPCGSFA